MNEFEPFEDLVRVIARNKEWCAGGKIDVHQLSHILRQYGWTHTTNKGMSNEL